MKNNAISLRLIIMNFLQFAVWGAYLTSMGGYLGASGLGPKIWLFFATQGFVSIFMPALVGIVADKWIPAQKVLSICHAVAGAFMLLFGFYAFKFIGTPQFNFWTFYAIYTTSVAFYMPTIAISNSVAFFALENLGKDPVKDFPPIRVFGTVGFICSMLFVNFMRDPSNPALQFQHSYWQFYVSGILGLILSIYSLSLPNCPCKPKGQTSSLADSLGLRAFKLFGKRHFAIFFIFAMLLGAALQITNGYANTFITSFKDIPAFADTWGARNANALISISQMSETLCILLIPFFMKKFGIKGVMLISMFAWVLRFGLFGAGNPGSGVWMFVLSCIVYGMAFDFFNISGALYVNKNTSNDIQSSAQGLFMLMTNGLGASIGTWAAGKVVNAVVYNSAAPSWPKAWFIFAGYALVVAIAFAFLFKEPKTDAQSA